ncbi:hypothetical protein [Bailinhaonella thermotolerans]|uniref:Uncharacterized protein n=1 Tax=Bailinhaonella thermotolerans TaxID=1070861 RepID=A0A3A4BWI4_9ACTN|nr:hypothetical protein [Bailinhaonella thermotolerans]RJL35948.1 hypothetical protein D5H75_04045 [Bailinhaonella thermotolerans]
MSRVPVTLRDRTADAFTRLMTLPDGVAVPAEPSALCLKDTKACVKGAKRSVPTDVPSYFPGLKSWDPPDFADWIFTAAPLLTGPAQARLLNVSVAKPAPAGYTVNVFASGFGSPDLWPMAVAVATPKGLPDDKPSSFLVLFQNTPMQDPTSNAYRFFEPPWGWDWLFYQFWRWFGLINVPICANWAAWGLPYQLTRAGKKFVLVIPQMPIDTLARDPARYAPLSGERLARLLGAIQQIVAPNAGGADPAHVALAGFSNGNLVLSSFLKNNLAKHAAAADRAMLEKIREIYVFAPPEQQWAGAEIFDSCAAWKAAVPAGVLRAYTHAVYDLAYEKLLGRRAVNAGVPFDGDNKAGDLSLSYLPYTPADNVWTRACQGTLKRTVPKCACAAKVGFDNVHHWIPGLALTHAAARSPFL